MITVMALSGRTGLGWIAETCVLDGLFHRSWDRSIADRHPAQQPPAPQPSLEESFESEALEVDSESERVQAEESVA